MTIETIKKLLTEAKQPNLSVVRKKLERAFKGATVRVIEGKKVTIDLTNDTEAKKAGDFLKKAGLSVKVKKIVTRNRAAGGSIDIPIISVEGSI